MICEENPEIIYLDRKDVGFGGEIEHYYFRLKENDEYKKKKVNFSNNYDDLERMKKGQSNSSV